MSPTTPVPPSDPTDPVGPFDRRIALRVVLAVVAICAGCVVATLLVAPRATGSARAFERAFIGACTRGGGEADACRCAFDRWAATVPEGDRAGLDERLARGEALPAEVREALAGC